MRLPPTKGKAAQRPSKAAPQTTQFKPKACADYHTPIGKLATMAALFVVEVIGAAGLIWVFIWRSVNA